MGNCSPLTEVPIYEYECDCGRRLEFYRQIENRYDAVCPECGDIPHLLVSPVRYRIATPLPVYLHDGTKVYEFRDAPDIRPPTPPEELVRIGELSNDADRFGGR